MPFVNSEVIMVAERKDCERLRAKVGSTEPLYVLHVRITLDRLRDRAGLAVLRIDHDGGEPYCQRASKLNGTTSHPGFTRRGSPKMEEI